MTYEVRVPALGESIVEATVSKWLKRVGDTIAAGEPVVELETDKVNLEVPAEQAGVLVAIAVGDGTSVKIGDLLATIDAAGKASVTAPAAPSAPAPTPVPPAGEVLTTPVAAQIAAQNGIDVRNVVGSGPSGRVTKEDVLKALASGPPVTPVVPAPVATPVIVPPPPPPLSPTPVVAPLPPAPAVAPRSYAPIVSPVTSVSEGPRREERSRMSRRRQTIARRLVDAQRTAAMLTTFNEIDMRVVMGLRQRRKESFKERYGVGLGFMSFFTKAVVGALKAFPLLNAEIQGEELVVKHYYDIGVAVGVAEGLVVPVVRDADRKGFAQLEREIGELANRARQGTLSLVELQGGTFTITNGGTYGSLMSTPILNAPQVGILGMHKIQERPVAVKGEVVIRPMMYVALSYDHRIVDGSTAVRFLVRVKELVEDPEALLLEG